MSAGRPCFDRAVPAGGYAWWYVDALSDDGEEGITLIAFVGSVFSPYYAWSRDRDPLNHCALNVALYRRRGKRWCMTERGRSAIERTPTSFIIGPSALSWDGEALTIAIDEITAPLPSRMKGTVRVRPLVLTDRDVPLDAAGRHRWWPIAPKARVEVAMERPDFRWAGTGYFDSNWGAVPLESDFLRWNWSRAALRNGTAVLYDVVRTDGSRQALARRYDGSGGFEDFTPPPEVPLPQGLWRVARSTQADSGFPVSVSQTLEDTPFYTRSILRAHLLGEAVTAMHESLSLERLSQQWVKLLLPFRMPRVGG